MPLSNGTIVKLQALRTVDVFGNNPDEIDGSDQKLIEGLKPELKGQFPDLNLTDSQATAHAQNFLKLFDNRASDAANFILDADKNPQVEELLQKAKSPEEALTITEGIVNAYKNNQMASYVNNQLKAQAQPQQTANNTVNGIPEYLARSDENAPPKPEVNPVSLDSITSVITPTPEPQSEMQVPFKAPEQETAAPAPTRQPAEAAAGPSTEDLAALEQITEMLKEHVAANPQDQALAKNFMDGVISDTQLQESLKIWKEKNADVLNGEGSDSMIGGFDKDKMIHDLLQGYKDDKEKVYATLQSDNFQMNAFMQYSDMGKRLGFLIEPILEWIGELFGQDGDLAGFANMNLEQWFADFQDLLGDGTNNLLAMGNNLDFGQRVGGLFNVVVGAAQDAGNMTSMDRYYRDQESPAVSITHVDSNNSITGTSTFGAGMALPGQSAADLAAEEQRKQQQALANQQNLNAANNSPTPVTGAPGT